MKRKILFFVFLSFAIGKAYSQDLVSKAIRGERGISRQFVSFEDDQAIKFNLAQVKSLLALNQNSDLVLRKTEQDNLGFTHYRFYQTYNSIPIENSMYIAHTKNGLLQSLSGAIVTEFDQAMNNRAVQRTSSADAIKIAVSHVNAKEYAWQVAGMERQIKEQTKNSNATYRPTANLVWYGASNDLSPRSLRLCYKVDVYATQPVSRAYYFVDAITGKVIGKKDLIQSSDAVGTAATAYSGSVTIHSDLFGGSYRLRDYTKGSGVITLHGESGQSGNDYTSASANWSLAGTNIAALDAHYGVSQTYAFYYNVFGRNSYDGAGAALYSYVNAGCCDNAYWNGSYMTFLQFSGGNGGVTAIDVTGHEVTHGVTQETSGLNYSYESGAMNESMSDIMGKSVQFWSKPSDIDWNLSNDMGWFIRDLSNPNHYGQPDTYLGTYWYTGSGDNGGVHYNSGVGNFMFYLLVNGGYGTNDNGDAYSVTGIGLTKADAILYRTNAVYLVPTSQYVDWRTACINAAADLYGGSSNEVNQVKNAWHAVGIGDAASGCTVPQGLYASYITNFSAVVNWSPAPGAVKYRLRYRRAGTTDWITINNIFATSYYLSGLEKNTTYQYKVWSSCAGGVKSAYSPVSTFTTTTGSGPAYCSSVGTTSYEFIDRVKIGVINNLSGDNGGYADFTGYTTDLARGSLATIKLTPGFNIGVWSEYWEVYIDYNKDGDFTDGGEKVATGVSNSTTAITKSFTVPGSASLGKTRMRIIMHYNSYLNNSCPGYYYDGETEDYGVKITAAALDAVADNSVKENTLNSIAVSPNPVKTSSANLTLQVSKAAPVSIKITDLSGRILRTENVSGIVAGKNNYSLRNINLLPGTYMIIAQQNNAVIARTQFIVDK